MIAGIGGKVKYTRKTTKTMKSHNLEYIPALDHLRFLAASLVFVFHAFHQTVGGWKASPELYAWGFITEGHTGVSLFFVLSGFVFMTIGLQGEIRYAAFLKNRLLRIFPLFLLFFVIAISIGRDHFRPADLFYVLVSNLGLAPTSNHFITGAAWTISIEFGFYLVFPFLSRFSREQGPMYLLRWIGLLLIVKFAAFAVSEKATHMFYSTLIGRFDQFLWGMIAALLWNRYQVRIRGFARLLLPLAAFGIWSALAWQAREASFFLSQTRQFAWLWWGSLEAILWSLLMICYLGARLPWPSWLDRALCQGGRWSYSLYLWHCMVIFLIGHYAGYWMPFKDSLANAALNMALCFPLSLAIAALSYHTIEKPFLGLRAPYLKPV